VPNLVVVIPTINEAGTIKALIEGVEKHQAQYSLHIIVVDDGSTDGTLETLERLAEKHGNITVIERERKLGFGSAIRDGLKAALQSDLPPDMIVTIDADLSHDPEQLPTLTGAYNPDTIVIGSRYVDSGEIHGWGPYRKLASSGANFLVRVFTNIPARDCTSGYRCYGTELVQAILPGLESTGYDIQIETLENAVRRGHKIVEVPIKFTDRHTGESKLNRNQIWIFLRRIITIFMSSGEWRRILKFMSVGLSGVIVTEGLLWLFTDFYRVHYVISALLSIEIAILNNFIWNEIWTFKDRVQGSGIYTIQRFLKFNISRVLGMMISVSLMTFFTEVYGIHYLISNLSAVFIVFVINYLFSVSYIW
jgi:dolichol-phosphate mannosyltransferase